MTVAAVILAAGFSRRLGRPKQDALLSGQTLLQRAIGSAVAADLRPVIAVVRDLEGKERLARLGALAILNENAAAGMSSSVVAGVRYARSAGAEGVVLLACDQPLLRPAHLRALCADLTRITGSAYAGRVGVPAFFPSHSFPALEALEGDKGARDLLQGAATIPDEALALDIDTEADLLRAEQLLS